MFHTFKNLSVASKVLKASNSCFNPGCILNHLWSLKTKTKKTDPTSSSRQVKSELMPGTWIGILKKLQVIQMHNLAWEPLA